MCFVEVNEPEEVHVQALHPHSRTSRRESGMLALITERVPLIVTGLISVRPRASYRGSFLGVDGWGVGVPGCNRRHDRRVNDA